MAVGSMPLSVAEPAALPPGTELHGGRFRVGKVIEQGRCSVVYLGSDVANRTPVVVKEFFPPGTGRQGAAVTPPPGMATGDFAEQRQHFVGEGGVLRWFHHPGIVHLVDAFGENDTAYLVLQHVRGTLLEELVRERGPLPEMEALRIAQALGDALIAVHHGGFLHLDVNPRNVMVTDAGGVVLLGFGAARAFGARGGMRPGKLTDGFAAPEQYGERALVNASSDVYGLAATLYYLLTTRTLPPASQRVAGDVPPGRTFNASVSAPVDAALARGLELEIAQRPATIRAFLELLSLREVEETASRAAEAPPARTPSPAAAAVPDREGELLGHTNWVSCVAFSPDGSRLASGAWDESIRLWDLAEQRQEACLAGHRSWVGSIAFSPDGASLVSGGDDRIVRLWDLGLRREARRLEGHRSSVSSVAFSPDGRTIASGGWDRTIRLWDLASGEQSQRLDTHAGLVSSVAFSPDGTLLSAGNWDRSVYVWHLASGKELLRLEGHGGSVRAIAFGLDSHLFASAGDDGMIRLWDLHAALGPDGALSPGRQKLVQSDAWELAGHAGTVWSLAFSGDGRLLASGSEDRTVRIWELAGGSEVRRLEGHEGPVWSVAFSPDGHLLASGSWDQRIRLWPTP